MHMPDWHCSTCEAFSILGGELSESAYAKNQQRIAEHKQLHAIQLAEHNGDHEALRFRLRHPSVHAALQKARAAREANHD